MVALLSLLFVGTVLKIIFLFSFMYFDMTFQYEGIILIIAVKVKIGKYWVRFLPVEFQI